MTQQKVATPAQENASALSKNVNHLVAAQLMKTRMCVTFLKGACRDKKCRYAHSEEELRRAPDLTKTSICKMWVRGKCKDPKCKFAHGEQELRVTPQVYRTQLCNYFLNGSCKKGAFCRHAHESNDLRDFETAVEVPAKSGKAAEKPLSPTAATAAPLSCEGAISPGPVPKAPMLSPGRVSVMMPDAKTLEKTVARTPSKEKVRGAALLQTPSPGQAKQRGSTASKRGGTSSPNLQTPKKSPLALPSDAQLETPDKVTKKKATGTALAAAAAAVSSNAAAAVEAKAAATAAALHFASSEKRPAPAVFEELLSAALTVNKVAGENSDNFAQNFAAVVASRLSAAAALEQANCEGGFVPPPPASWAPMMPSYIALDAAGSLQQQTPQKMTQKKQQVSPLPQKVVVTESDNDMSSRTGSPVSVGLRQEEDDDEEESWLL